MLDVNLEFPQLLNLIVQLIQSLVLDSLLVVEIFKSSWDKIIEDGLWLVDHVFVEMMLDVDLVKSHVRHLLDSIEVKRTLFVRVVLG